MKTRVPLELERILGMLLHYGTIVASVVIAAGLVLSPRFGVAGWRVANVGIALFILLPVVRVGTMLFYFLRTGDHKFGAIAALVMSIILLSFFLARTEPGSRVEVAHRQTEAHAGLHGRTRGENHAVRRCAHHLDQPALMRP
jgi:uncharacterized membrane protein